MEHKNRDCKQIEKCDQFYLYFIYNNKFASIHMFGYAKRLFLWYSPNVLTEVKTKEIIVKFMHTKNSFPEQQSYFASVGVRAEMRQAINVWKRMQRIDYEEYVEFT